MTQTKAMPRLSQSRLVAIIFATSSFGYAAVGYWLCVHHGFILGDTLSRVAAAQTVLFSRDPHVAAIGFVFTPLTALMELPTVALSPIWPIITDRALSGVLMSAIFMGGAAAQVFAVGSERGLPRRFTFAVTALFALNPMIIFYGSNGMSEAPYIFFTCWAVRRIIRWIRDDDVHHLVTAGIALGFAYLTRYDAVGPIAATWILVAAVTYARAQSGPRLRRALLDGLLVAFPGFAAFAGWASISWLITGQGFAQFSSQYGNASILAQSGGGANAFLPGVLFAAICTLLLAPSLLPVAAWVAATRARQHDWLTTAVPFVVFGAALAFQALSYATGSTFGFLRFYILAIPLTAILAVLMVPESRWRPRRGPARTRSCRHRQAVSLERAWPTQCR